MVINAPSVQVPASPSANQDVVRKQDLNAYATLAQYQEVLALCNSLGVDISTLQAISHTQNTDCKLTTPNHATVVLEVQADGSVHITGDIFQEGSSYETHAEELFTKNDIVILRDGATSGLGPTERAGLVAKLYDGLVDGHLLFDSSGVLRVGDAGDEQPLATREETPLNGGIAVWNATNLRFESVAAAPKATKLEAARNINGTPFDGTQDITIKNYATVTETSILVSNWSGTSNQITVVGLTPTSCIDVSLAPGATEAVVDALIAAKLIVQSQSYGAFYFKCYGVKPTVDIPIVIENRGEPYAG
jgi:hypothetical protein